MIIVKLKGGLGNQLFQYAFGRKMSIIKKTKLKFDTSSLEKDKIRNYKLDNFHIIGKPLNDLGLFKTKFLLKTGAYKKINEEGENYSCKLFKKNIYLNGYWQNEYYFRDIKKLIKKEISLKHSLLDDKILSNIYSTNSISIHIRRGDYISNPKSYKKHGVCSLNYYIRAINFIKKRVVNPHFFIFSDDVEWVKNNLKTKFPLIFISGNNLKDYEELILMSRCKHNIIANSAFSWWGAWLNENENKIVIAPYQWLKIKHKANKNIISNNWTKLK